MGRTPNDGLKPSVTKKSIRHNGFAWNGTRAQNISWSASFIEVPIISNNHYSNSDIHSVVYIHCFCLTAAATTNV